MQSNSGWAKPGGEYSYGDYGTSEIGGAYQTLPDASPYLTTDLKSASTYDIGYGGPIGEQVVPTAAIFPIRSFGGWGWKQPFPQPFPQPVPVPIYAKPVPYPIATIPVGWGWQGPGIF